MGIQFPTWGDAPSPCGNLVWSRRGIGHASPARTYPVAFWAAMRPSTFLALATPLLLPRPSLDWLGLQAAAGRPLCPPSLHCWLGSAAAQPVVVRHDGRHRTTLARGLCHDAPIPVLVSLDGPGAAGFGVEAASDLARRGMRAQRSGQHVPGPLFGEDVEEATGQLPTGIPPPRQRAVSLDTRHVWLQPCGWCHVHWLCSPPHSRERLMRDDDKQGARDIAQALADGYQGDIVLVWENGEPPEGVAQMVIEDIRHSLRGLPRPSNLCFHGVRLSSDWNGPGVHVTGREGSSAFYCTYDEKTVWVDGNGNVVDDDFNVMRQHDAAVAVAAATEPDSHS